MAGIDPRLILSPIDNTAGEDSANAMDQFRNQQHALKRQRMVDQNAMDQQQLENDRVDVDRQMKMEQFQQAEQIRKAQAEKKEAYERVIRVKPRVDKYRAMYNANPNDLSTLKMSLQNDIADLEKRGIDSSDSKQGLDILNSDPSKFIPALDAIDSTHTSVMAELTMGQGGKTAQDWKTFGDKFEKDGKVYVNQENKRTGEIRQAEVGGDVDTKVVPHQFGSSSKTFKDENGELFFATTSKDPSTGTMKTVFAAISGDSSLQPIGKITPVGSGGLTAAEKSKVDIKKAKQQKKDDAEVKKQADIDKRQMQAQQTRSDAMPIVDELLQGNLGKLYGLEEQIWPDKLSFEDTNLLRSKRDQLMGILEAGVSKVGQGSISDSERVVFRQAVSVLGAEGIHPKAARDELLKIKNILNKKAGDVDEDQTRKDRNAALRAKIGKIDKEEPSRRRSRRR